MDHPFALAACLVTALAGVAMLLAFGAAFSQLNILARSIQVARQRKKGFVWWYFLGDFAAGWQIWRETKGLHWLPLVGAALGFTSYVIYRVYLA